MHCHAEGTKGMGMEYVSEAVRNGWNIVHEYAGLAGE